MTETKLIPPLLVPKGWRMDSEGRAVDPCGCLWIPESFSRPSGAGQWRDVWQWSLYVPLFGFDGTAHVARDGMESLPCPIDKHCTITLPDGRKVAEGNWHH